MPLGTRRLLLLVGLLTALIGVPSGPVSAHVSAIGYGHIRLDGNTVTWSLLLDPWHLDSFLSLDADDNAEITPEEVAAHEAEIVELVVPGLEAMDQSDATYGSPSVGTLRIVTMADTELGGEGFTELADFPLVDVPVEFAFPRDVAPENLVVSYGLFLESGFGDHWNTARIDYGDASHTVRFTAEQPAYSHESARANDLATGSSTSEDLAEIPDAAADGESGGIGLPAVLFVVAGAALAVGLYVVQQRRAGDSTSRPPKPSKSVPTPTPRSSR